MIEKHYSPKQLVGLLSLSRTAIHALLYDGTLPHVRLGGRILVPESSVQRALDEGRMGGVVHHRRGRVPFAASL
jgi:excisionase family DNA binding protein